MSPFTTYRSELPVVEEITSTVWKSLNREAFHVGKNLVGLGRGRASSTSTSTSTDPWDYEAYISFRGEDTRNNFRDYLYAALCQKGIRTFAEDLKGRDIASTILEAIKKSRCILIIFSENYASSRWCLQELEMIIQCKNQNGKLIIPIFYHIEPSDVRKQRGRYEEAFCKHEISGFADKTQRWREAMTLVANLSGWHIQNG